MGGDITHGGVGATGIKKPAFKAGKAQHKKGNLMDQPRRSGAVIVVAKLRLSDD